MKRYISKIRLTVLGPFLTAASSTESYGLDKAFYRLSSGEPAIPATHIKGKLRMSLEELNELNLIGSFDLSTMFGLPSAEGTYDPARGQLSFSSFTCKVTQPGRNRVRTAIQAATLTAAENQLREFEDLFPSGTSTDWSGSVTFFAEDNSSAIEVVKVLRLGFIWLTNIGAEKGIGSGRVEKVLISIPELAHTNLSANLKTSDNETALQLHIRPVERLLIGGVKKPRANFVRSERIIPGGVIKGALAASLNQAHGIKPSYLPLTAGIAKQMPDFAILAQYFDRIRITHAFPAIKNGKRPVKVPLSTVEVNQKKFDLALTQDACTLIEDQAPLYCIDWKEPFDFFEIASPKEVFVTRTKIDNTTRRAQEGQLFTYSFLCPEDGSGQPVEWVCNVDFSAIQEKDARVAVRDQFVKAVSMFLGNLGKLNHPVTADLSSGFALPTAESLGVVHDGQVIVTLQTDALMLDPREVANLSTGEDLKALYASYWLEISKTGDESPTLELVNFFASQNFQGGYLYHRYLGAGERRTHPDSYYPYYLTEAGSVFVLKATESKKAQDYLDRWMKTGLDLPKWSHKKYSQPGRAIWQNCPFVPENGYGEIAVNLKWHWEKQAHAIAQEETLLGGE